MIPIPPFLIKPLIACAVVVAAYAAGYGHRWVGEAARVEARLRLEQELAAEDYRHKLKVAASAATKTQGKVDRVEKNFAGINTTLTIIETREVYRRECVDDDGLRLWNDANQGRGHERVQRQPVDATVPADPRGGE